jgi:hypothetical protein
MLRLTKHYEISTNKSKEAILLDINRKVESQKRNNTLFSFYLVDYSSFKVQNDQVEIERQPSMFNPFRGIGTIYFNLEKSIKGTTIKCILEPYSKFSLIATFGCLFCFLMLLTVILFFFINENYAQVFFFILFMWTISLSFPYLMARVNRSALEEYSRTVLSDLNIKISSS